jgi:hypothetical protein
MMMNYKFGSSLGKTETDAHIYGVASAAADCFKALAPFFFFAALRNRIWSQAVAAALVWVVVTGYAFTSALGHAALNRFDTSGQRVAASSSYKDLRADLKRAEDQLKWIPPTRPPGTIEAELNVLKAQRAWMTSKECTDATIRSSREFCQQYFKLSADLASGQEAEKLRVKIATLSAQTAKATGAAVLGMADPQANVIARLTGLDLETVQTSLMLFVALLIEIGSGFGMYVAFAYWRPNQSLHGESWPTRKTEQPRQSEGSQAPLQEVQPAAKPDPIWTSEPTSSSESGDAAASGPPAIRPLGDNDNKTAQKWIMPENDVELFYKQGMIDAPGETVLSQDTYDAYKLWADRNKRRKLHHAKFSEEFEKLGHKTVLIADRKRYPNIKLTAEFLSLLEKKASFRRRRAQQAQDPAVEQPRPALDASTAAAERLRAAAGEMGTTLGEPEAAPDKAKAA